MTVGGDDLVLADLIDGFPVTAPWVGCGAVWFDDLASREVAAMRSLFEHGAATGWWPPAPDVEHADDPSLVAWTSATLHVVSRLCQETLADAEALIAPTHRVDERAFVAIPGALGPSLDLLEHAREPIDTDPACIAMAMSLNALTIRLADTGTFPSPPPSLARHVDLERSHWADATYRNHRGRDFFIRLDLELAHVRGRVAVSDTTAWDLHAWVFALVRLWTGRRNLASSVIARPHDPSPGP